MSYKKRHRSAENPANPEIKRLSARLLNLLQSWHSCAVAFSGGVDSAVVAAAAHRALGRQALAVTARSASLAQGELTTAARTAAEIGIRHLVLDTAELDRPQYAQNAADRCFWCKTELYTQMRHRMPEWGVKEIVNGTNRDDLDDYRPGLKSAEIYHVKSPLVECWASKQQVRQLARLWRLTVWDKPAGPCLASRIAYGQRVTPERLRMIDAAEQYLKDLGFEIVRVRYLSGDRASIEVPREQIARLTPAAQLCQITARLTELGFVRIAIDPNGYRAGNMNRTRPQQIVSLKRQ